MPDVEAPLQLEGVQRTFRDAISNPVLQTLGAAQFVHLTMYATANKIQCLLLCRFRDLHSLAATHQGQLARFGQLLRVHKAMFLLESTAASFR